MRTPSQELALAHLSRNQAVNLATEEVTTRDSNSSTSSVPTQKSGQILMRLLQACSFSRPFAETLDAVTALVQELLGVDLSVLTLVESEYLVLHASSPDLSQHGLHVLPLDIDLPLLAKLAAPGLPERLPPLSVYEREQLNPLKNIQYGTLLIIPLLAEDHCIGAIHCYSSRDYDCTPEDLQTLYAITTQCSLAFMYHRLREHHAGEKLIAAFFDELLSDAPHEENSLRQQAVSIGSNCYGQQAAALIELMPVREPGSGFSSERDRMVELIKLCIRHAYPGSLVGEREHILYCLIALGQDTSLADLQNWLNELAAQFQHEHSISLFSGVGRASQHFADFRQGFAEAKEALQVARRVSPQAGCLFFSDLGVYRYLLPFVQTSHLPDPYLEQIETIARYDQQHKRSELLHTLEQYLTYDGCIKKTAGNLNIHRNTVLQRLERIQSLCGVDLDHYPTRFQLHLALLIYKLRAS